MLEQNTQNLSPLERQQNALRVLSDAEFIRGGAYYNELGRLTLTDLQLEKMNTLNIGVGLQALSPEMVAPQWLDSDLNAHVHEVPSFNKRVCNTLYRDGVNTIRDILVIGELRLSSVPGLGDKSMAAVKELLKHQDETLGYLYYLPTPDYIATIAGDLSQVTARAIGASLVYGKPKSVQDILVCSPEERGDLALGIRKFYFHDEQNYQEAAAREGTELLVRAQEFSSSFWAAKSEHKQTI